MEANSLLIEGNYQYLFETYSIEAKSLKFVLIKERLFLKKNDNISYESFIYNTIVLYIMLTEEWKKFKGWLTLEFFLRTNGKIHVRGLAKNLKISPRTAQLYLQLYEKSKILKKEKVGNIILYSLSENPLVFEFKKLYSLINFMPYVEKFTERNPEINTVALYGSHASGRDDNKSDMDLLIISQTKKLDLEPIRDLEKKSLKEVKIQIFSIGEWKNLVTKNDLFALSVLRNHTVLYGASL
jgi:predicted nucleotidyltransferase